MDRTMREQLRRTPEEVADLLALLGESVRNGRVRMFGFSLGVPAETEISFELHPDPPNERIRVDIGLSGGGRARTPGAPELEAELSRPGG